MSAEILEEKVAKILPEIQRYPLSIQSDLLKYYLVYLLKDKTKEQVVDNCKMLFSSIVTSNTAEARDDIVSLDLIMQHLGVNVISDKSDSEKMKSILSAVDDLKSLLTNTLATKKNAKAHDDDALKELIEKVSHLVINTESEMNDSAKEMFDRVLTSLDPAKADNFLDQSISRKGLEKKAALYDAMCEKYEQLFEYHESGRLLKDFRRLYKAKLNNKSENK